MEFKPTIAKSIVSSVIALILGIYFGKIQYIGSNKIEYNFLMMLAGFVIVLVLIYMIWSLFQKKTQVDNKSVYVLLIGLIISILVLGLVPYLFNQPSSNFSNSLVQDDQYGLGIDFNQNIVIPEDCNDFFECRMYKVFQSKDQSLCNSEKDGFDKKYCLSLATGKADFCLELPSGSIGYGKMEKTGADYQYQIDSENIKCVNKLAFQYRDADICNYMNQIEGSAFMFTPNGIGGVTAKSGMIAQCMYTATRADGRVGDCNNIPLIILSEVQNPSVIEGYMSGYSSKEDIAYLFRDKCVRDAVRTAVNPLVEYCDEIHSTIDKNICQMAVAIKDSKKPQEPKQ